MLLYHFCLVDQKLFFHITNNIVIFYFYFGTSDQVKIRLILQLIKGKNFQDFFQKLLKYYNGAVILTSFVLPAVGVFPVILI